MAIRESFLHEIWGKKWAIRESFLCENRIITNSQKFSLSKVSHYTVSQNKVQLNTMKDFVYQDQQVVKPTLEKKCGLTNFRQEDSINYKKFLPEKIIAYWGMMGILPTMVQYHEMPAIVNVYVTRYMLPIVSLSYCPKQFQISYLEMLGTYTTCIL